MINSWFIDGKWAKFEQVASDERELKMTLHLLHFCTHGGKKAKEMIDEVAEIADSKPDINDVNDADLSEKLESMERQFGCDTDDLFCNAVEDTVATVLSGFHVIFTSLAIFALSLIL